MSPICAQEIRLGLERELTQRVTSELERFNSNRLEDQIESERGSLKQKAQRSERQRVSKHLEATSLKYLKTFKAAAEAASDHYRQSKIDQFVTSQFCHRSGEKH